MHLEFLLPVSEPGYYDDKKEFGVRLETIVMAAYVETEVKIYYVTFKPLLL